ncbi:MAG: rod shape-determining protein MreC [Gemmatimonadales bacterium]
MNRGFGRVTSRSDTLLFLGCLALGLGALALPAGTSQPLASRLRDTVFYPLLWVQQRAVEGRTGRTRFRAVQAERDSVALAAQLVAALRAENDRLRAILGLSRRAAVRSLPAEVLHQAVPTEGRTVLLSIGQDAGAAAGDPVAAPEGLIGVILNAGQRTSVAMTWAHPDFRVSAVTEDGSVLGIVAPSTSLEASEAFLEFRGVPYRDTVETGVLVMTSGLGGVYPRGIPLGRVAGVRREELGWERVYRLLPAANPGHVAHVVVLKARGASAPGEPVP